MKFTVETVKRKNRLGLKSADFYLVAVRLLLPQGCLPGYSSVSKSRVKPL